MTVRNPTVFSIDCGEFQKLRKDRRYFLRNQKPVSLKEGDYVWLQGCGVELRVRVDLVARDMVNERMDILIRLEVEAVP